MMKIKFTKEEYFFIKEKFNFTEEETDNFTEDEYYDLQDKCCDIEIDAITEAEDNELSADGELASSIVTKIGEALCEDYEDDEDDEEANTENIIEQF